MSVYIAGAGKHSVSENADGIDNTMMDNLLVWNSTVPQGDIDYGGEFDNKCRP